MIGVAIGIGIESKPDELRARVARRLPRRHRTRGVCVCMRTTERTGRKGLIPIPMPTPWETHDRHRESNLCQVCRPVRLRSPVSPLC